MRILKIARRRSRRGLTVGEAWNRCPVQPGVAYQLRGRDRTVEELDLALRRAGEPSVVDRYLRARARPAPTRARAVTALLVAMDPLLDMLEPARRPFPITVVRVDQMPDHWEVSFVLGDRAAHDEPVFLGRGRDYVMSASQSIDPDAAVLTPLAKDLEAARRKAAEKRLTPQEQTLARIRAEHETLRASMLSMKARNRLRQLERETARLAEQLALDAGATLSAEQRAPEAGSPPDTAAPPAGTGSVPRPSPPAQLGQ